MRVLWIFRYKVLHIPCNALYVIASINRGPRGILSTRGEKAHTSIRVSIIACNNVISKVKCATWASDVPYGAMLCKKQSDVSLFERR